MIYSAVDHGQEIFVTDCCNCSSLIILYYSSNLIIVNLDTFSHTRLESTSTTINNVSTYYNQSNGMILIGVTCENGESFIYYTDITNKQQSKVETSSKAVNKKWKRLKLKLKGKLNVTAFYVYCISLNC